MYFKFAIAALALIAIATGAYAQSWSDRQLYSSGPGGTPPLMYNPYQSIPSPQQVYIPSLSTINPSGNSLPDRSRSSDQRDDRPYSTIPGVRDDDR